MNITIPISDTRIAAALSTLGIPLKIDVIYDDHSGVIDITFHMEILSVLENMNVKSNEILKQLKDKSLSPIHPVSDGLRALHNRKCIIKFLKEVKPIELVPAVNGDRYVYRQGGLGLPGKLKAGEMITTQDIKVVAALGSLGVPLLAVEQLAPNRHKFYLPIFGLPLNGEVTNAAELVRDLRNGSLEEREPEHPFLYSMVTQHSYDEILRSVEEQEELILLKKKRSSKAAYIRAGASDKAFDTVKKHFGV